jgi:glutathione S-transferase
MQLIGMLDSPYVRRVAIALVMAAVRFEHKPISLFRHVGAFTALSPLLKAPSLIADDGGVFVESGVILEYLATLSPSLAALRPKSGKGFRLLGVALTVMEKAVQFHYERALRGPGEQSETWRARVTRQLRDALAMLDAETPELWIEQAPTHADIAIVCAWTFVIGVIGDAFDASGYTKLNAFAARAESLDAFLAVPPLDGATVKSETRLA